MNVTYEEFIQNILNTRGRFGCGEEYHERHHILPRCMGGTNDPENLINLFAREHFEAHRLLALENPDNPKIIHAWWMMSTVTKSNKKRVTVTSEEYEEARKALSQAISGENNPWYGKSSPRKGAHLSEEQKQHLREINLGERSAKYGVPVSEETRRKISLANRGKVATEETRQKLREAHLGKNMGVESGRAKQVAQYDLDGILIKVWDCMSDVARQLNITSGAIYNACSGKNPTAGGYQFRYVDEDIPDKIPPYINQSGKYQIKSIARCDEDWNIIDVWNGYTAAQNGTGVHRTTISACCNNQRQHAGGYRWKILDENYEEGSTTIA